MTFFFDSSVTQWCHQVIAVWPAAAGAAAAGLAASVGLGASVGFGAAGGSVGLAGSAGFAVTVGSGAAPQAARSGAAAADPSARTNDLRDRRMFPLLPKDLVRLGRVDRRLTAPHRLEARAGGARLFDDRVAVSLAMWGVTGTWPSVGPGLFGAALVEDLVTSSSAHPDLRVGRRGQFARSLSRVAAWLSSGRRQRGLTHDLADR